MSDFDDRFPQHSRMKLGDQKLSNMYSTQHTGCVWKGFQSWHHHHIMQDKTKFSPFWVKALLVSWTHSLDEGSSNSKHGEVCFITGWMLKTFPPANLPSVYSTDLLLAMSLKSQRPGFQIYFPLGRTQTADNDTDVDSLPHVWMCKILSEMHEDNSLAGDFLASRGASFKLFNYRRPCT